MSDTNQVVIYWKSEGKHFNIMTFMDILNGNNMGWSLDYEIGAIDRDNNFGEF